MTRGMQEFERKDAKRAEGKKATEAKRKKLGVKLGKDAAALQVHTPPYVPRPPVSWADTAQGQHGDLALSAASSLLLLQRARRRCTLVCVPPAGRLGRCKALKSISRQTCSSRGANISRMS